MLLVFSLVYNRKKEITKKKILSTCQIPRKCKTTYKILVASIQIIHPRGLLEEFQFPVHAMIYDIT